MRDPHACTDSCASVALQLCVLTPRMQRGGCSRNRAYVFCCCRYEKVEWEEMEEVVLKAVLMAELGAEVEWETIEEDGQTLTETKKHKKGNNAKKDFWKVWMAGYTAHSSLMRSHALTTTAAGSQQHTMRHARAAV